MDRYQVLKQVFGYESFRNGQEETISHLEENRDTLCILPTGGGKSICYQVPALLKPGATIVISPLVALMSDQVKALVQKGVSAAYINSSLTLSKLKKTEAALKQNKIKILYVAPERLENEKFLELIKEVNIAMVVVDEAHCISQWGQDFRPAYLQISKFIHYLPHRPVVAAFTATADTRVQKDICQSLHLIDPWFCMTSYDRENLFFGVKQMAEKEKLPFIRRYLKAHPDDSGIIYCSTVAGVEEVYEDLLDHGFNVGMYHGQMPNAMRQRMQDDFIYDNCLVMVATNAFGMGIDKPNVSFVLHHNMPGSIEAYYQEAGRAGRDGGPGECILLYSGRDYQIQKFFIDQREEQVGKQDPGVLASRRRLDEMMKYVTGKTCLRKVILEYFGQHQEEDCGHCSVCQTEYDQCDITREAQILLSTVKRTRESFGAGMIAEIVHGSQNSKIRNRRLDEVSTYGLMRDRPMKRIREIIDYLVGEGYLFKDKEQYPRLHMTINGISVLKGKKVSMKTIARNQSSKITTPTASLLGHSGSMEGMDQMKQPSMDLIRALRLMRMEEARARRIPPYTIFNDATLFQLAKERPQTEEELLKIKGMGQKTLENYGQKILDVISQESKE